MIFVPPNALWAPGLWWALLHETAHIVLDRTGDELITDSIPEISAFLTDKLARGAWSKLIQEIAAEVIGYELGFFGDQRTVLDVLWKYLLEVEKKLELSREVYILRTFFVEFWEATFRRGKMKEPFEGVPVDKLDDEIYSALLRHIERIEKRTGPIERKHFIAAYNVPNVKGLVPCISYLFEKIGDLEQQYDIQFRASESWLSDTTTDNILGELMKGRIYSGIIPHPEAILYRITKEFNSGTLNADVAFQFATAATLTFWNAQLENLKENVV